MPQVGLEALWKIQFVRDSPRSHLLFMSFQIQPQNVALGLKRRRVGWEAFYFLLIILLQKHYCWGVSIFNYSKITVTRQIRKLEKGSDESFN